MTNVCPKVWCTFFKAIHDEHRQLILDLLKKHGELNATEIVKKIKLSQPTVSHHLKILHQAELIHAHKNGKEMMYSLNPEPIIKCCNGFKNRFAK